MFTFNNKNAILRRVLLGNWAGIVGGGFGFYCGVLPLVAVEFRDFPMIINCVAGSFLRMVFAK